ncbi:replication fork protection component Swi3-domain-containing protein [Lentinula lateritia]|uniref:Chromosome segregation in meiosis protein n=1 Tax=Lentinula lateritia TaxID=40482 RepID=A0ABQ8UZ36_9AGAR|nr:replication fork protection component Swi3-domain-containing protein [Lentinula lateritia]
MDIFDDDNEVEIISRPSTSASTASFGSSSSSQPLFLPDHDDEDEFNNGPDADGQKKNLPQQQDINVDKIFDSVVGDDLNFDYVPLARNREIDYANLEREAQRKAKAHVPLREILSSSPPPPDTGNDASKGKKGRGKDDGEKERRKPMRLDEARLVGPTGFPQLIEDTKHFRIKGKGHEATDLNRLLQIYQYWTHRMYPKSQFKDTVDRVEKLCHSKLMHNKLSMWRDEAHGKAHPNTEDEGTEGNADDGPTTDVNPEGDRRVSSLAPESDAAAYASSSPSPPTHPPSSTAPSNAGGDEFDDQDMEAIWKEMETEQANEARRATTTTSNVASRNGDVQSSTKANGAEGSFMDVDDDIEGWLALEEATDSRSLTSTAAPTGLSFATAFNSNPSKNANGSVTLAVDDDDEMWGISHEMEAEDTRKQAALKDHSAVGPTPEITSKAQTISTTERSFDDMYC